jgi:hemerythrin-like domain-containing protein
MSKIAGLYKNISQLNKQHQSINEIFIEHQKLLMHDDFSQAQKRFKELQKYIHQHIDAENEVLLPLYEAHVSPIPAGGAVEFFVHEHHKIIRYLNEFSGKSATFEKKSNDLVPLFDRYYKFKHLLDHHHSREDTFLFRLLDRVLTKDKKKEVLKNFIFNMK